MGIGIVLALGAAGPAFGTFYASSQLCYGADCSERATASRSRRSPTACTAMSIRASRIDPGSFDENATVDVAARQVTFEVGFTGSELDAGRFPREYDFAALRRRRCRALGAIAEDHSSITATGTVLDEVVRLDDVWWANDWNDPDVFTTQIALAAGTSYTLVWLGFEGCCGGATTIRFSFEGGPFQILNEPNLEPFVVPEAGMATLVGLGLGSLAVRRRSAKTASPCVRGDRRTL